MDNELTRVKYIDAHRLRVYKDGTYQNVLDLSKHLERANTTEQGRFEERERRGGARG